MAYFAVCNLDVYVSTDKKRLRKAAKRARFRVQEYGWVNRQTFATPERCRKEFGISMIWDLDQRLIFGFDTDLRREGMDAKYWRVIRAI